MLKRVILLFFPICISVFLFSFNGVSETYPKAQIRTLIIDPGHGGIDPGARGDFSTEADVSLAVSLKFGKALQEQFPDLELIHYCPIMPLRYWLAGGLKKWTLLPNLLWPLASALDHGLVYLSPEFGSFVEIELVKR